MHTDRCSIAQAGKRRVSVLLLLGTWGLAGSALAGEPAPEPAEVVQDQLKSEKLGDRVMPDARDWRLDPAVFTELAPFTAPETAIRLPADQSE
jgi:hypothetical protein